MRSGHFLNRRCPHPTYLGTTLVRPTNRFWGSLKVSTTSNREWWALAVDVDQKSSAEVWLLSWWSSLEGLTDKLGEERGIGCNSEGKTVKRSRSHTSSIAECLCKCNNDCLLKPIHLSNCPKAHSWCRHLGMPLLTVLYKLHRCRRTHLTRR